MTVQHMNEFVAAWQLKDPDGDGWIHATELAAVLAALPRQIGHDPLAGEDPIECAELRLPPLPNGEFSRFLLTPAQLALATGLQPSDGGGTNTADENGAAVAGDGDGAGEEESGNDLVSSELDEHEQEVHFDELLYALAERKCGTPLPSRNKLIRLARIQLGNRLVHCRELVEAQLEREKQQARQQRLDRFHVEEKPPKELRKSKSLRRFGSRDLDAESDNDAGEGAEEREGDIGSDTQATRAKTRTALLGGLRSGALEEAVAKMEADTAGNEDET